MALVNALASRVGGGRPVVPAAGPEETRERALDALRRAGAGEREVDLTQAGGLERLATRLRAVFTALDDGHGDTAAAGLNALLDESGARPHLQFDAPASWHLHFHPADAEVARGWAAGCATALAHVLGSEQADRLGICSAPRCDRVFIDLSRNGSRRYCSTACQNRVKTAAYRARGTLTPPRRSPG